MDTSQSGKRVLNPMLDRLDPITTQDPTEDPIADNTNEKAMNDKTTMKTYRIENKKRKEEQLEIFKRAAQAGKLEIISLSVTPKGVDMVAMHGTATEAEKSDAVEELYHNAGYYLDLELRYDPHLIDRYGKDFAQNAQGIYYHHWYEPKFVKCDRKIWIPSLEDTDWDEPFEADRRRRARIFSEHARNNEDWNKSEYAWEADAWSDVFGQMRDDPYLTVDKHEYNTRLPSTHEVFCTLTEESSFVKRIPDATFGLATFPDYTSPVHADELDRESLENLLLHPKCGLIADPAWGSTNLAFPFAVYEAKGWNGDCREARRQAWSAAAVYLDLLDNLARKPGPVDSQRPYQTSISHRYQVFALTSFGAHWHLLVGHRQPRVDNSASCGNDPWEEPPHFSGKKGMSEILYVFQRLWSGRVTNEMMAWELLSLVDQVHNWAKTDHRTFVLEHLKAWHDFCSENYLLDWDSKYNIGEKRKRACKDDEDLLLPDWTKCVSEQRRQQIRSRAKYSLAKAQIIESQRKGKGRAGLPFLIKGAECYCRTGACGSPLGDERGMKMGSRQKLLDHLQIVHCVPVEELARVREVLSQGPPTPALEPTRSDQRRVGSYMNGIKRVMERCAPKDEAASLPEDHVQGDTANAHQESADEVLSNGVGRSKRRKAS